MVFAVLVPVVGLVLAIVARVRAKRGHQRQDGLATAALVVSIVLTSVGLAGVLVSIAFSLFLAGRVQAATNAIDDEAGTSTPRSEAIASIQATGADGVVSGGIIDDAVKAVLLHRIARSGMRFAGFQQNSSGNWIMQFDSETSLSTIMRSAQVLAAPTTGGLRRIVAVEGNGAGAGAAFGTSTPISPDVANTFASTSCEKTLFGPVRIAQDLDVACSPDLREKYLLGETVIPADDITSVQPGRDSLRILLNPDGARHLSDFSSAAFQEQVPDDQLAVAAGGEVLVAPALSATITNGILDINGNLTPDQIELVDSQLTLMTSGVHFTVVSAHAAK